MLFLSIADSAYAGAAYAESLLANAGDSVAQQKDGYDTSTAEDLLSRKIAPLADELSKLLVEVSPRKDGQVLPVFLQYQPFVPINPGQVQRVTYDCPWGATFCGPFLRACAATQQSCTCSDYGSIDPDPC
jgi:hypothetical protein